jgi:hypothetical protein
MTWRSLLGKFQVHHNLLTPRPEELVTAAYQALLGREPEPGGLKSYSDAIRDGHDLTWLIHSLIRSEEFGLKHSINNCSLDTARPMNVQTGATTQERRALWDHIENKFLTF